MADTRQAMSVAMRAAAEAVIAHAEELTALDRAIGDGDHGINMTRGAEAVLATLDDIAAKPPGDALKAAGTTLVMTIGGASGPLYGSLLMGMGKAWNDGIAEPDALAESFAAGVAAVAARGKSHRGQKTMLDVLIPVLEAWRAAPPDMNTDVHDLPARLAATAESAVAATRDMKAERGRASFLGERSIGHIDPGARSSCLMIQAVCGVLGDPS